MNNQAFCYDEQNRLTWAGSQGTPNCGTALTPGTLTTQQARYTATYGYDVLNRLTNGPQGAGYTYGDSTHLDALTSVNGYTASYDAAGSMTCRAPTSSLTCTGTPTGQALQYDALRRLLSWQDKATSPTKTAIADSIDRASVRPDSTSDRRQRYCAA